MLNTKAARAGFNLRFREMRFLCHWAESTFNQITASVMYLSFFIYFLLHVEDLRNFCYGHLASSVQATKIAADCNQNGPVLTN